MCSASPLPAEPASQGVERLDDADHGAEKPREGPIVDMPLSTRMFRFSSMTSPAAS